MSSDFSGSGKRAGLGMVVRAVPRARRPIEKSSIFLSSGAVGLTQVTNGLALTTIPSTVGGFFWDLNFVQDAGSAVAIIRWAIVIDRNGVTLSTMSSTNGGEIYSPVNQLIVAGAVASTGVDVGNAIRVAGHTKTQRKMKAGDDVVIMYQASSDTQTWHVTGVVTFFQKY